MRSTRVALIIFLAVIQTASFAASKKVEVIKKVITYPVPDAVIDSPYTVTVDGKSVPIEQAGKFNGAYYARFQFNKPVKVEVSVKGTEVGVPTIKPERLAAYVTKTPGHLKFHVDKAGPRMITTPIAGKDSWPLVIIAENYDASSISKGPKVINVKNYVTSEGIQTANVQKALDECAARPKGGIVYFAPGIYHTGTIRIKDNTTVYLAPGAVIMGSAEPVDYPIDAGRLEQGTHGKVCSFSRLVMFDHCKNSSIIGYGVIDGRGDMIRNHHHKHVQLMDVTGCKNIKIENIVLRNSAEWTLHILGCENVTVDNLKIMNDLAVSNTDGIDPDGSKNVMISRYFGFCGDDAIAIKTTGNSDLLAPSENVTIKDSIVCTSKSALKVGTETYADVRNVLFENCDVISSSRGCAIWGRDGGKISGVTYRNIRLDLKEIRKEDKSGEPVRVDLEQRNGLSKIENITFDRINSSAPFRSILFGLPESTLENITFKNCIWKIKPRTDKMSKSPVFEINYSKNFLFKNQKLVWIADPKEHWDRFIGKLNSEDIVNEGFKEEAW